MKRFVVISKEDTDSIQLKQNVTQRLVELEYVFDSLNPELVVTIGGDGTFLRAIHQYIDQLETIQFVGIHTGTLGFFSSYDGHECEAFVQDLLNDKLVYKQLPVLDICVKSQVSNEHYYAINEMRVENVTRTQLIRVLINNEYMETFRGTGLCISTQAGSTAYNRSLGGAILHEGLDLLQLTEITGIHHHAYRSLGSPLIVQSNALIRLESDDFCEAILCFDHLSVKLKKDSLIQCQYSKKTVHCVGRPNTSYLKRLKSLY
jgi:NAD+ kinase